MKYFFDTEFVEDGVTIMPLSLGIVSEDGREGYWEVLLTLEEMLKALRHPFVSKNVLPHMGKCAPTPKTQMVEELLEFVGDDPEPEFWAWYCVGPETRVLTADLQWVSAGSVKAGDELMGFDEEPAPGSGRSSGWRQWRKSTVLSNQRLLRPCYDFTFEDGTKVRSSVEHRWLHAPIGAVQWRTSEKLSVGDCIVKPLSVWEEDRSWDAGYLAAAFDGEGHLLQTDLASKPGSGVRRTKLGFAQRDNAMLFEVVAALDRLGYRHNGMDHKPRLDGVRSVSVNNRNDVMRFLGSVRPRRLLEKFDPDAMGAMSPLGSAKIISKVDVGEQEVIAMGTSTGTFIAEGLASHNSAYDWVLMCQLFGNMTDLPPRWPKYCMDLRQHVKTLRAGRLPENDGFAHHALADALWVRKAYESLTPALRPPA